jgi:Fe-S cluster biosynthesis and repair protein YggX
MGCAVPDRSRKRRLWRSRVETHPTARAGSDAIETSTTGGKPMPRIVHCIKLQRDAEGLAFAPWPGELGRRIYENVSKEAWAAWLAHQTMLINENRLNPLDAKTRTFIAAEMEQYFFGAGSAKPEGYVAPDAE